MMLLIFQKIISSEHLQVFVHNRAEAERWWGGGGGKGEGGRGEREVTDYIYDDSKLR